MDIPVIDLAPLETGDPAAWGDVARQWDAAFSTLGFATIVNHGIDESLVARLRHQVEAFFRQPVDVKRQCSFPGKSRSQGYVPVGAETVAATQGIEAPPDLCEVLVFAHADWDRQLPGNALDRSLYRPNLWPESLPELRPAIEDYQRAGKALAHRLMQLSALALNLPPDYFGPLFDRMPTHLRLVVYPDQETPPLPGQLRNGPHTDFGGFTILRQEDAPGGLQVQGPDGDWYDVAAIPNSFVINSGDLIQRWTNDRWRSNLHRVANPPRDLTGSTRRLSIVLFTGPNYDAEIACLPTCRRSGEAPRYAPISAEAHMAERYRQAFTGIVA